LETMCRQWNEQDGMSRLYARTAIIAGHLAEEYNILFSEKVILFDKFNRPVIICIKVELITIKWKKNLLRYIAFLAIFNLTQNESKIWNTFWAYTKKRKEGEKKVKKQKNEYKNMPWLGLEPSAFMLILCKTSKDHTSRHL
jgi:hypothetical protein